MGDWTGGGYCNRGGVMNILEGRCFCPKEAMGIVSCGSLLCKMCISYKLSNKSHGLVFTFSKSKRPYLHPSHPLPPWVIVSPSMQHGAAVLRFENCTVLSLLSLWASGWNRAFLSGQIGHHPQTQMQWGIGLRGGLFTYSLNLQTLFLNRS